MDRPSIVVLGGGFAGLHFIKHIDTSRFHVTLVDRNNFHSFPPLFYQVASSGLDPTDISFPFRRELRRTITKDGTRFHMGTVSSIDVCNRTVTTDTATLRFDILIIAMGTTNNFFSSPSLIDEVYTLKSTDEAIRLRNELLHRCERAAATPDRDRQRRLLSFTIIGGGPAGVEIAGAIGEMKRYVLPREFPEINPDDMTIRLFEGTDRLLRTMSPKASATALRDLSQLMVDVHLGHVMKSYRDETLTLDDGTTLHSGMVIWTAGVKGTPFSIDGLPAGLDIRGPGGRIITDDHCRVKGLSGIYAIGDIGYFPSATHPRGLPQLAQPALQQGRYLADLINTGRDRGPFTYRDKGSMATIGRNRAVAELKSRLTLTGFTAWIAWMFIHLISLLGMRNRLSVLLNWTWAYFTHNTALRLLLKGSPHPRNRGSLHDRE